MQNPTPARPDTEEDPFKLYDELDERLAARAAAGDAAAHEDWMTLCRMVDGFEALLQNERTAMRMIHAMTSIVVKQHGERLRPVV